ncbi:MAG: hypothetical protein V3T14_04370 [Myxococcota bacterium]
MRVTRGKEKKVWVLRALILDDGMKIAAARTIAGSAEPGELVPPLLNRDVHQAVGDAVAAAARRSGAAPVEESPA